jgi:hypothetical protein
MGIQLRDFQSLVNDFMNFGTRAKNGEAKTEATSHVGIKRRELGMGLPRTDDISGIKI